MRGKDGLRRLRKSSAVIGEQEEDDDDDDVVLSLWRGVLVERETGHGRCELDSCLFVSQQCFPHRKAAVPGASSKTAQPAVVHGFVGLSCLLFN